VTVAMTYNFLLNNAITFRNRRQKGWHILTGMQIFYTVCPVDALINVAFTSLPMRQGIA
jgi:dolichol-phosphate mannosyltransferase